MPSYLPQWLSSLVSQISAGEELNTILASLMPEIRDFLDVDRVIVCQFDSDSHVQVIAESIKDNRLPSLLLSSFPTDYIALYHREIWQNLRIGTVTDVNMRSITQFSADSAVLASDTVNYFPINTQQSQNFQKLGIQAGVTLPIFQRETFFGFLIAHKVDKLTAYNSKLDALKVGVEQLAVAIHQQTLQTQVQQKSRMKAQLSQVSSFLQSDSDPDFQAALEEAVLAFQGIGGRLCMSQSTSEVMPENIDRDFMDCLRQSAQALEVYKFGAQPELLGGNDMLLMEQYPLWQHHHLISQHKIWPVSDISKTPELRPLFRIFQPTAITALLMIPLVYSKQLLGYLCIFRGDMGALIPGQPMKSQQWDTLDQAESIAFQFSASIHKRDLQKKQANSQTLILAESQRQKDVLVDLQQKQSQFFDLCNKITQGHPDIKILIRNTTKEFCKLLKAERVSVYMFYDDFGGEFLHDLEYVVPAWQRPFQLGENTTWNDSYLQDTKGGRYRYNDTCVVNDIHKADLSPCHIDILEQFGFKAFMIAPILLKGKLWGLFAVYQQSAPRDWQALELGFLKQVVTALGLAMEKSELAKI